MLGTHTKQPAEKEQLTVNFAKRLALSETVSSGTVTSILVSTGASTTSTIISSVVASGTNITFYVQAGSNGETHQITITATTSNSQILEEDLTLVIKSQ